jgi:hypothetical protein
MARSINGTAAAAGVAYLQRRVLRAAPRRNARVAARANA